MRRILAIFIIGLFLFGPVIGPAHAFTYERTLPSNTIYFDDFGSSNGWMNETTGSTAGMKAQLNNTLSFDTPTSFGLYTPNANSHIGIMKNIAIPAGVTRIGMSAWLTHNYAMYLNTQGNTGEMHM